MKHIIYGAEKIIPTVNVSNFPSHCVLQQKLLRALTNSVLIQHYLSQWKHFQGLWRMLNLALNHMFSEVMKDEFIPT